MKRFISVIIAAIMLAALCAACTPGALVDTLNGLGGATPGNAFRFIATPGNAAYIATPGNAVVASPANAVVEPIGHTVVASPSNAQ